MCTAISWTTGGHFFGRTLDLEISYNEAVTVTPRKFPLHFRDGGTAAAHYAIIGIAAAEDSFPLYYDGMNERGLCMAALNFPDNACYLPSHPGKDNISSFEVIPWILGRCASVRQARDLLVRMNVTDHAFSEQFPPTPLHWILADGHECVVLEPDENGLAVYENPVGVLTNNPPFPFQLDRLRDYLSLSPDSAPSLFHPGIELREYSRGMGAFGMPGDYSSASRFVRAAFVRSSASGGGSPEEKIVQFFRMTEAVRVPRGVVRIEGGTPFFTVYTSCYTPDGQCCCSTYEDPAVTAVSLSDFDVEGRSLQSLPLPRKWRVQPMQTSDTP